MALNVACTLNYAIPHRFFTLWGASLALACKVQLGEMQIATKDAKTRWPRLECKAAQRNQ
eukprot:945343-Pleurochrysis_carterae.AAC.1